MPKVFTSASQKTGEMGENIAVRFLMKQGYSILERNYTKKWGEIDIITEKEGKLHFVEVKSVSSTDANLRFAEGFGKARALADRRETDAVSHGTNSEYRPEDNMHPWKLKRLSRTIQTYLLSEKV